MSNVENGKVTCYSKKYVIDLSSLPPSLRANFSAATTASKFTSMPTRKTEEDEMISSAPMMSSTDTTELAPNVTQIEFWPEMNVKREAAHAEISRWGKNSSDDYSNFSPLAKKNIT